MPKWRQSQAKYSDALVNAIAVAVTTPTTPNISARGSVKATLTIVEKTE
jgi:hypothetical protein